MGEWTPLFLAALAPRPSPAGGQRKTQDVNQVPAGLELCTRCPSLGWGQRGSGKGLLVSRWGCVSPWRGEGRRVLDPESDHPPPPPSIPGAGGFTLAGFCVCLINESGK